MGLQLLGLEHMQVEHPPQLGRERAHAVRPGFTIIFSLDTCDQVSRSHPAGPRVVTSLEVGPEGGEFVMGWLRELRTLDIADAHSLAAKDGPIWGVRGVYLGGCIQVLGFMGV